MAVIPRKAKIKNKEFGIFDFETFVVLMVVFFFSTQFLIELVHDQVKFPALAFVLILAAYCIFESSMNKGKKGYQRIFICLKYVMWKLPEKRYRH